MPASDPAEVDLNEIRSHANLIWGIAKLLRGDYKQADYGKVILPLVVMRRLDQALEPTKAAVVAKVEAAASWSEQAREQMLARVAGQQFFNRSSLSFPQLLDDPGNIAIHLHRYVEGYSALARHAIDHFDFEAHIDRLDRSNLLYQVVARVCEVDLSPARVSNLEMGYLFEELIRRFAEQSNETAGEHFTPREVVRLMVNLLLDGDDDALSERGAIRTIFDAACGTGGMLSEGESQIRAMNDDAEVYLYGQELNPESYAICLADMLVKDKRAEYIVFGNSLSADGHGGERFHYGIANPPFGVDWSKVEVAHGVGRLLGRDGHGHGRVTGLHDMELRGSPRPVLPLVRPSRPEARPTPPDDGLDASDDLHAGPPRPPHPPTAGYRPAERCRSDPSATRTALVLTCSHRSAAFSARRILRRPHH